MALLILADLFLVKSFLCNADIVDQKACLLSAKQQNEFIKELLSNSLCRVRCK